MRETIRSFAALSLAWAAAEKLLPEGRKRQAAQMVCGLLCLLLWTEGIASVLGKVQSLPASALPQTVLTQTNAVFGASAEAVNAAAAQRAASLAEQALLRQGMQGTVKVTLTDGNITAVNVHAEVGDADEARRCVAASLNVAECIVTVE